MHHATLERPTISQEKRSLPTRSRFSDVWRRHQLSVSADGFARPVEDSRKNSSIFKFKRTGISQESKLKNDNVDYLKNFHMSKSGLPTIMGDIFRYL